MTVMLSLRDVAVSRGDSEVLRGVTLDAAAGRVTTILGSNGMGKSTTLRTISGLHRPSRGTVEFQGRRVDGMSPRDLVRAGVVHVPEGRQVFPGLSVRDNLRIGAYCRPRAESHDIGEALEYFPALERFLDRPAGSLSGGQQQMLALGRGLMARPKLLLLDEPTLGLAPVIVDSLRETLLKLKHDGRTIVLVEQNAELAFAVADHAYVLVQGRVSLSGPAEELASDDDVRRAYLGL